MACHSNLGRGVSGFFGSRKRFPPQRPLLNHRQSGPPERGGNPQNRNYRQRCFAWGHPGDLRRCAARYTGKEKMQLTRRPLGLGHACRHLKATGRDARRRRNVAADSRFPLRSRVLLGPWQSLARFANGCGRAVQHTSSECFFRIKGEPNFTKSRQSYFSQRSRGSSAAKGTNGICRSCGFCREKASRIIRSWLPVGESLPASQHAFGEQPQQLVSPVAEFARIQMVTDNKTL